MMPEDRRYDDFDLQIRSMLQDAEEEVPSRVWDAVSGRIAGRKVISAWWRRAAAGVAAAAAAVAVGIFLMPDSPSAADGDSAPVAEAEPAQFTRTGPDENLLVAGPLFASGERKSSIKPAAREEVPPADPDPEAVPAENPADEQGGDAAEESSGKVPAEEYRDDPFARMAYDDASKRSPKRPLSGFVQGNVTSNESSRKPSGHMASSSSGVPSKTGVNDGTSISTYGIPLSFGVGAKYRFAQKWSVSAALSYSLLSRSFTGTYTEVTGGRITKSVTADITNNLHYIGIPVNVYYDILESNKVSFYAFGGVGVEKGLVNKYRIHGQPAINYSESVSGIQVSSALGLGFEFMLNDYLNLYVDPSARYYFDCGQPRSVRTQKPFMMNLEVGLRFKI